MAKADVGRIAGMREAFNRAAAGRGVVSPGDALYKSASLVVYSAPRYNVDPLYFLRTLGDYGVPKRQSCEIDSFGAANKKDALTNDARSFSFEVATVRRLLEKESCMQVPMADLRARTFVSACLYPRR